MRKHSMILPLSIKKNIALAAIFILLSVLISATSSSIAEDFSGTWLGKTEIPSAGPDEMTLVLKKEKDTYTGTIVDTLEIIAPDTPIQSVSVEDNLIHFSFPLIDEAIVSCELIREGDQLIGGWTHPSGSSGSLSFEKKK